MKRKFRRVRGGFIPYMKPGTSSFTGKKLSWTAKTGVSSSAAPMQRFQIPGPRAAMKTQTQPKLQLAPRVQNKVQTQTEGSTMRRRSLKYLPAVYRKKPRFGMGRRPKGQGSTRIQPTGEGATRSFYFGGGRLRKKQFGVSRLSPQQTRLFTVTERQTNVAGRQHVWSKTSLVQADLNAMLNSMPVDATFPTNTKQLAIQSVTSKYMITNTAATNVFVDIYECVPRQDCIEAPVSAWGNGLNDMQAGIVQTSVGTTPYMSPRFTKNWLIMKKITLELAAGRTHMHTSKYNIGRTYSEADSLAAAGILYRQGFAKTIMMVAYSEPINTVDGLSVTPAPVSINALTTEQTRYYFGESKTKDVFVTPLAAGLINTAGLQLYDEGSGTVEGFTAA